MYRHMTLSVMNAATVWSDHLPVSCAINNSLCNIILLVIW